MDVLIVEPLDPEVLAWLSSRRALRFAPQLAQDPHAFRKALYPARAAIVPPHVTLDADVLLGAPLLRAVGRVSAGAENIDTDACTRLGIEVVRPASASATAEAEFAIATLLQMLRRVPVVNADGLLVGRELAGCTVGIVGMAPAARPLGALVQAFGAHAVGYDPAVHASDALWQRWRIRPLGLRELFETCDAVVVLLPYYTRYRGLLGERVLGLSRPNQVLACLSHSSVFDEVALAQALSSGRMAAAWFDSAEPGLLDPGRPLRHLDTVQVTPQVASTTLESRQRGAWAVARRIDELLGGAAANEPAPPAFRNSRPDDLADLADAPAPA
jgi:phosphoglycerate dehydrogenase-like enzyme